MIPVSEEALNRARKDLRKFMETAPVYRVPFYPHNLTMEELVSYMGREEEPQKCDYKNRAAQHNTIN